MHLKQLNHFECPNCGGIMEQTGPAVLECPYCGSRFRDNSAPAPAAEKPAAPAAAKPAAPKAPAYAPSNPRCARILEEAVRTHTVSPKAKHVLIGKNAVAGDSYRYSRAKVKMGIPENAECYLLYSDLNFGFNTGFALCDTGLYYCPELDKPMQMTWAEFAELPMSISGNRLYLGDTYIYIYEETGAENLLPILGRIQEKL